MSELINNREKKMSRISGFRSRISSSIFAISLFGMSRGNIWDVRIYAKCKRDPSTRGTEAHYVLNRLLISIIDLSGTRPA